MKGGRREISLRKSNNSTVTIPSFFWSWMESSCWESEWCTRSYLWTTNAQHCLNTLSWLSWSIGLRASYVSAYPLHCSCQDWLAQEWTPGVGEMNHNLGRSNQVLQTSQHWGLEELNPSIHGNWLHLWSWFLRHTLMQWWPTPSGLPAWTFLVLTLNVLHHKNPHSSRQTG